MGVMKRGPTVCVVGATGAVGSTLLRVLEQRNFPLGELRAFASPRSVGTKVHFRSEDLVISAVSEEGLRDSDFTFFAAGSEVSRRLAPVVAALGGIAVDKSGAYRADPQVPLIVPEVNALRIAEHHGIISNPNCVVIPLTVVLSPLSQTAGLRHLTVATYQSASGAGWGLVKELRVQTQAAAAGLEPVADYYPHPLLGNVVPGGWPMDGENTEEEVKVVAETRRVLEMPDLPISVSTVRVPVEVGHSLAVWAEFENDLSPDEARELLKSAPSVVVADSPQAQVYPTPRMAAGTDSVYAGRIRRDVTRDHGLSFFITADNLRKGAATNAVQVAEMVATAKIGKREAGP